MTYGQKLSHFEDELSNVLDSYKAHSFDLSHMDFYYGFDNENYQVLSLSYYKYDGYRFDMFDNMGEGYWEVTMENNYKDCFEELDVYLKTQIIDYIIKNYEI